MANPIHILQRGNRRLKLNETSCVIIDPVVDAWAKQVVSNGGVLPSINTQLALHTFYRGLVSNGLLASVLCCNCFAPDNLIACQTPLIQGAGFQPWTNGGSFSAFSITDHGLQGASVAAANNFFLNTGFGGTSFPSDGSIGVVMYTTGNPATNGSANYDIGYTNNAGTQAIALLQSRQAGGITSQGIGPDAGNGALSFTGAVFTGYLSMQRTSTSAASLYFGNSTHAHTTLISDVLTVTGTRQAAKMYVGGINGTDQGNANILSSGQRYAFVAFTSGLSSANDALLFNLVQALRTTLGGAQ